MRTFAFSAICVSALAAELPPSVCQLNLCKENRSGCVMLFPHQDAPTSCDTDGKNSNEASCVSYGTETQAATRWCPQRTPEEYLAKAAIDADTFVNGDCLLQAGTHLVTTSNGDTRCAKCPKNTYGKVNAEATTPEDMFTCVACPTGTYTITPGSIRCYHNAHNSCPAGTFSTGQGCSACEPGTYQDEESQTTCKKCGEGKWSVLGATVCTPGTKPTTTTTSTTTTTTTTTKAALQHCDAGSYSHLGKCTECPANTFTAEKKNASGSVVAGMYSHCTPCAKGTFAPIGSTACSTANCVPGRFHNGQECFACPKGRFQDESNANSCKTCYAGKYTWEEASTECNDFACTAGFYHADDRSCKACGINTYQEKVNQVQCNDCPYGKFQLKTGQNACLKNICKAGEKMTLGGCEPCPAQTYSRAGALQCIPCDTGFFSWSPGSAECVKSVCRPGSKETASGCTLCAVGEYQPEGGQTSCKPCGAGLTSFQGAVACHRSNLSTQAPRDWTATKPHVCRHVKCTVVNPHLSTHRVQVTHDKWFDTHVQPDTTHKCAMDSETGQCLCICQSNGSYANHEFGKVGATHAAADISIEEQQHLVAQFASGALSGSATPVY